MRVGWGRDGDGGKGRKILWMGEGSDCIIGMEDGWMKVSALI